MRIKRTDINMDIKYGDLKGYRGISMGYLNKIKNGISIWIYILDKKNMLGYNWITILDINKDRSLWISMRICMDMKGYCGISL